MKINALPETKPSACQAGSRWPALAVPWVLLVCFFLSEHKFTVSRDEAFTSSADQMEAQADGGNMLRRAIFGGLGLLGVVLTLQFSRNHWNASGLICMCLIFYHAWCVLSVAWSDAPSMTIRRVGVLVCFAAGAFGVAKALRLSEILNLVVFVCGTTLFIGILSELALGTFRPWAGDYRFAGTLHPNTQGLYLSALCLSAFCLLRQGDNRRWLLVVFLVGFCFLILTKSRTSCAGMLLSLCPLWALRSSKGKFTFCIAGTAWAASIGLLVLLFMDVDIAGNASNAALLGREEQAETLTGRLPIWEALQPFIHEGYVLGYGYDSFWVPNRVSQISSELQWGIREAHSAYLDTILSVGVIGGGVLLLAILASLFRAAGLYLRTNDSSYGFLFGLYLFGLINAFTESGMMMPMFVPFIGLAGMAHLACFGCESSENSNVSSSQFLTSPALS